MAYLGKNIIWEIEFANTVFKKDKLQDMNTNQLKIEIYDIYKKAEKLTKKFKAVINSDVINKAYLDEKLLKTNRHLSLLEKHYNEFISHYNKQSVEEILVQRAVKRLFTD